MRTNQQPDSAPELERLIGEREALRRRMTALDLQIERVVSVRQDELARRLAAVEEAVARLYGGAPSATPSSGSDGPVATRGAGLPATPAPPVPDSPPPAQPLRPAPAVTPPVSVRVPATAPAAAGSSPKIVGERVTVDAVPFWAGSDAGAPAVGTVRPGTRVLLTEVTSGHRVQIVFQNTLVWADPAWLGPVPTAAPTAAAVTRPASEAARTPVSGQASAAPAQPAPPAQPVPAAPLAARPVAPPAAPPTGRPSPRVATPAWRRPGFMAKLLALVGAGVTLIGVAFLLVLAAQYGMFGPEARTISAALLAAVLIALAFVVRRRDPRNVGAPILAATGVAAAFLSVVTATVIYGWLPSLLGAGLAALIGLGGMLLARRWDNEWVALVSVLGGLVLAAYIGEADRLPTAMMMVVMTGVTLWFERGTGWRMFPFARVLPTVWVLVGLSWSLGSLDQSEVWWLVLLATAFALLGLFSAVVAPDEPPAGQGIALGLLVPMVVPAAMAPRLLDDPRSAAGVLGLLAVVFVAAGFLPRVPERVRWAAVPLGAGFTMLAVLTFTEQRYLGMLTLALACGYLAVAARSRSTVNFLVGGVLAVVGILNWSPWLFTVFDVESASAAGPEQVAQSLAGIAVVVLATLAAVRWLGEMRSWLVYVPWAASVAMGSVAMIHSGTWLGRLAGNATAGFQTGQAATTIAWMALCVLFLQRGLAARAEADVWLHLALATAALAVAKLFLFDLGMLNAIARVGAFLVVGLLLLFVGTRYARAWERAHGDGDAPGPVPSPAESTAGGPEGDEAPQEKPGRDAASG